MSVLLCYSDTATGMVRTTACDEEVVLHFEALQPRVLYHQDDPMVARHLILAKIPHAATLAVVRLVRSTDTDRYLRPVCDADGEDIHVFTMPGGREWVPTQLFESATAALARRYEREDKEGDRHPHTLLQRVRSLMVMLLDRRELPDGHAESIASKHPGPLGTHAVFIVDQTRRGEWWDVGRADKPLLVVSPGDLAGKGDRNDFVARAVRAAVGGGAHV